MEDVRRRKAEEVAERQQEILLGERQEAERRWLLM